MLNVPIEDNGYGYYCDPGKLDYEHVRPQTSKITGLPQYYTFHNPDNTINEEALDDYESQYYESRYYQSYHTSHAVTDKINMYTNMFIYGCVIVASVTITSTLIHYKLI